MSIQKCFRELIATALILSSFASTMGHASENSGDSSEGAEASTANGPSKNSEKNDVMPPGKTGAASGAQVDKKQAAPAAAPLGRVSQIFRDKKQIVVTLDPGAFAKGLPKTVVVTTLGAEACEGAVIQSNDSNALVDFWSCSSFSEIKGGAVVVSPAFPNAEESRDKSALPNSNAVVPKQVEQDGVSSSPASSRPLRFVMSVGYFGAGTAKFSSVKVTTGGTTRTGDYSADIEGAPTLSFGVMYAEENHWGFYSGLTFQGKRDIKTDHFTLDGSSYTVDYSANGPSVQCSLIEVNALYRWGAFYLPFGLNYSKPYLNMVTGSGLQWVAYGGLGAQLGVGFILGENVQLELLSQAIAFQGVTLSSPTVTEDLGNGILAALTLRLGIRF